MSTASRAIVAAPPAASGHKEGSNWELQDIQVPTDLKDGELLIEMVASGICHTDLITTSRPEGPGFAYPRVVGHEGSGYVKAIGPNVKKSVKVGDPVLLSFDHCGECETCTSGHPGYCSSFIPLNILCIPEVFKTKEGGPIAAKSFGQSSFAALSIVKEASILPAGDLIKSKEELQLFAPLGCGIQTGAGAMLNVAKVEKGDRVMILGLGGVGLSAVMAASIAGCQQIVAVDRFKSRLELAKSFGATHGFDTTGVEDLVAAFKEITGGQGPNIVLDTTGFLPVLEAGYKSLALRGTFVFTGASSAPDFSLKVDIANHLLSGHRLLGNCEGDSNPPEFIPRLINYYRDGKLPLDKICKYYKVEDFKTALHDMHTGETIKPILLF